MLKRLFDSPYLLITLAGLYPALFLTSNNWFMYRHDQLITLILLSPIFTLVIGTVIYLILSFVIKVTTVIIPEGFRPYLPRFRPLFFVLYGCFALFSLFQSAHREMLGSAQLANIIAVLVTLIAWAGVRKTGFSFINFPLIVVTLVSCLQWGISYVNSADNSGGNSWYTRNKAQNDRIVFKAKPNVYLIVLESYQNRSTLKEIYGFDNGSMEQKLLGQGFKLYEKEYANYSATLVSLAALFTMQHHYTTIEVGKDDAVGAREIIGGKSYNPVLSVFRNNGYRNQFISYSDYTHVAGNLIDYTFPKRVSLSVFKIYRARFVDNILMQVFITYKGRAGKRKSVDKISGGKRKTFNEMKSRIRIAGKSKSPYFTIIKTGLPGHFGKPWNKIKKTNWYPKNIKKVNKEIKELIKEINKFDRDPLIILVGDHGAWRYRKAWSGRKDVNKAFGKNNVLGETVAKDLFATFLAIRYPSGQVPEGEIYSHVNLFRHIFSALCECSLPLETKVEDASYFEYKNKVYTTVIDGKPLDHWEIFKPSAGSN
jgi:hypothetical protein